MGTAALMDDKLRRSNGSSQLIVLPSTVSIQTKTQMDISYNGLIDNSSLIYHPIKLKCGVRVMCRPIVLMQCPEVLQDLEEDCQACLRTLPRSVHKLIRRTPIWVNATYQYGPVYRPILLNHSTAHHHESWLRWARDRPDKALSIEIYSCTDYRRMRLHWNGAGLLLHEFCHIIHQQVLPDGLENQQVKEASHAAEASQKYKAVFRRDWVGKSQDRDLAYALVDHKEFFAEMSVTFHATGYQHLATRSAVDLLSCCPPLMERNVIERVTRLGLGFPIHTCVPQKAMHINSTTDWSSFLVRPIQDWCDQMLFIPSHCNKFFPFTRGQLESFDTDAFLNIRRIWQQIEQWNDSAVGSTCLHTVDCWIPWKTVASVSPLLTEHSTVDSSVDTESDVVSL
jgi:hypothetical protein